MTARHRSEAALLKVILTLLALLVSAVLALHLVVPSADVDATTLGLLALLVTLAVLPFARAITFPGGYRVELREAITEASSSIRAIERDTPELFQREVPVSVPSLSSLTWRDLLDTDPNVALAGLRIEIERRIRTVAEAIVGPLDKGRVSIGRLLREPRVRESLGLQAASAIDEVVEICNRAVHAEEIPSDIANLAADLGEVALEMLDRAIVRVERNRPG